MPKISQWFIIPQNNYHSHGKLLVFNLLYAKVPPVNELELVIKKLVGVSFILKLPLEGITSLLPRIDII